MKERIITAIGYVIVLATLIVLKWQFPVYGAFAFDALFWLISMIGAYEFMRAVGEISTAQRMIVMSTCALMVPMYVVMESVYSVGMMAFLCVASIGAFVVAALLVFDFERSTLRSTAFAEFCLLYCGALGSIGSFINHMDNGTSLLALILLILLTAGADTFAFLFGKMLGKRLPLKLAPHTSPNKTVIGAVGGIIGGIIAGIVSYFLYAYALVPSNPEYYTVIPELWKLVVVSIPAAVFAQLGDLFESAIKRGCGIKDMGNLLPGHGGVLDRFDSLLFASIIIICSFLMF